MYFAKYVSALRVTSTCSFVESSPEEAEGEEVATLTIDKITREGSCFGSRDSSRQCVQLRAMVTVASQMED